MGKSLFLAEGGTRREKRWGTERREVKGPKEKMFLDCFRMGVCVCINRYTHLCGWVCGEESVCGWVYGWAVCELLCTSVVEGLEGGVDVWEGGRRAEGMGCTDVGRFMGREVWVVGVCSHPESMGLTKCIKLRVSQH